jgi:hypothetical protein
VATKVFLSWSGDLSRKLADALRNWLPSALQSVKPYFTPEDIEKGAKWGSEISKELETSNIGIVCLTRENTEKPWILFEAGALSKSIQQSHVCTLLFDLEPTDIKGPLTSFQATKFIKEDFRKLVLTINGSAGDLRLEQIVMDAVFEMWWPKLESQVSDILKHHGLGAKTAKRSERDILEELLELTRLNVSRTERSTRISPRLVIDLMEGLEELQLVLNTEHSAISNRILTRVSKPLRQLCIEAGVSDAYQKMRLWLPESPEPTLRRRVTSEFPVETGKTSEG